MKLGEPVTEMITLDHRSVAKLLNFLSQDDTIAGRGTSQYTINKIMDNITWKLGKEPNMVLDGVESPCDIVARSILELPLINTKLVYYITELIDGNSNQFIGACIYKAEDFIAQTISCYTYIDWLNAQDNVFVDRSVQKIICACVNEYTIHIKILLRND